ncbi:elongation factor P [bacterium BMS3Abin05]|nr:elongation factor P [bacterium BMS3Abin05]GBE26239.1 elongation factor P [bacterium BMS3Bbin03]HDL78491.1 elongation factor P [Bacteroidota bacterium]HDZ12826.1 elongation factor P [Bacteroidota bacterium]
MVQASQIRNGMVLSIDNHLWQVAEFQFVQPGKGGAFVRTKIKNLKTGRVIERTFRSDEKVNDVRVESKDMQYLYRDGSLFYFMDKQTYEQVAVTEDLIGDSKNYLKEAANVKILFNETTPIGIELPFFVELKVVETEPGVKGDTVSGATKVAKLETGAVVQVPLFIEQGEILKIDTRTGTYVERV